MKSQRGNVIVYMAAALFVASLGAGVVYTYKSAIARAEHAEADARELRAANSEYAAENQNLRLLKAQQDRILAERQERRNAQIEIERGINAALSKAMQQPEVRRWADTPIPGAILDSVRGNAPTAPAADGRVPAAGKPAAAPAGP